MEYDGLYRKHLAKTGRERIFDYVSDLTADNVKKRLYLITSDDKLVSVEYDGAGQEVLFHEPTRGFHSLDMLKNSLYCSNIFSNYVVELNVSSGNIHRFIPFSKGSHPSDVVVVDVMSSLKIDGKFCSISFYLVVTLS